MTARSFRLLFTVLLVLVVLPWTVRAADDPLAARLDPIIDGEIAAGRIVGAVVLVARDGAVVYARAAGWADREAGRTMTRDALFRLASLSKTAVSLTALALIDQGRLGLDDPVARWLPAFTPRGPDGVVAPLTVRHLLTHTAGLGYGLFEPADGPYHRAGVSDGLDQPGLSLAENLRRIASVPLAYPPGTGWSYSLATDVLGAVIEAAGGAPLPEMVARTVTRPLGLTDTAFVAVDPARLTVPYADAAPVAARMAAEQTVAFGTGGGVRFVPDRLFDPASYPSGGAGLVGSADDYLRLLDAIRLRRIDGMRPEAVAALVTPQTGDLAIALPGPGWQWGFGLPVVVDPAGMSTPWSAGSFAWGGVYGHSFGVDPARRLSFVILTNTAIEGMTGALPAAVRRAVLDAIAPAP